MGGTEASDGGSEAIYCERTCVRGPEHEDSEIVAAMKNATHSFRGGCGVR